MRQPSSTPWASSQPRSASSRSATASGSMLAADTSISRRSDSTAMNCSAESDCSARSTSEDSSAVQVSWSASTARAAAAAGLLSSWARPAASVPSATSASRWRDSASMLRTVWKKPSIRWTPKGNQERTSSPSGPAGTLSIRPGPARATRGEVPGRLGPGPEATGPDARPVHRGDDGLLASRPPHADRSGLRAAPTRSRPDRPARRARHPRRSGPRRRARSARAPGRR